jgi:hypothetical protein
MKYPLFELTPEKFVELCSDLFNAEKKFDKVFIITNRDGNSIDITGLKGTEKTAIQVKHKRTFGEDSIIEQLKESESYLEFHHYFIFVVSAKLSKDIKSKFSNDKIQIYDQDDLIKLLDKHEDVARRYFQNLKAEKNKTSLVLFSSLSGILASVIFSFSTIFSSLDNNNDKPLENKIKNVEEVLSGIKNLETDLKVIKEDMIETEIQNKRIILENEKLKGVEDLISKRKEELNEIVNYKPWSTRIFEFLFGTFFGIATSIFSSILYDKWKQRNALKE